MTTPDVRSWLRPHLASDRAMKAADAAATELGSGVHSQLLAAGDRVALHSEPAALAFYENAAQVFASLGASAFERWFQAGLNVATVDTAAAQAFFALESRLSVSLLRAESSAVHLDDELGVWRKLIEMLSDEHAVIRRVDPVSLRPPLERTPEEASVALPERIELFATREQNRNLYRFLALQLAGRREFGTYAQRDAVDAARANSPPSAPSSLVADLRRGREREDATSSLEQIFLLAEGFRVQQRIAQAYPGTAQQTAELAEALLALAEHSQPSLAQVFDALLAVALLPTAPAQLPRWLRRTTAERVMLALEPLRRRAATVEDSLSVAKRLLALFATPAFQRKASLADASPSDSDLETVSLSELASDGASIESELERAGDDSIPGPLTPTADAHGRQEKAGEGAADDGSNLAIGAGDEPDANMDGEDPSAFRERRQRRAATSSQTFLYDEWDHTIADYRSRYCRVHEVALPTDSSTFFESTRRSYASVLAQVRHEFERIRPERYRPLRGLEDGEDFDLNALIDARVEARAQRTPNTRVYTARTRQQRDVATLFLLDMSASTEQPYAEPGEPKPHRIIDTLKEAIVVMSSALDDLGDSYAVYGFSSHGRERVEVYPVKAFGEVLGPEVKARLGGVAPKNGTRMGAALRHVLTKFAASGARSKHLILLSDGFPQDQEYGGDRRTHTYGIQDTAVALRELSRKGVTPFCITVDRAGNDYLREMCAPSQYLIIEHLDDLPKELPKIYRRVVRS